MTFFLLALLSADAATFLVPQHYPSLAEAVDAANSTPQPDEIIISPGQYTVARTLRVEPAGGGLTIRGSSTPREIANPDIVEDTILAFDVIQDIDNVIGLVSMFEVEAPSAGQSNILRLEDLIIRQAEILCDDGLDNDGNGLSDGGDPTCQALLGGFEDTAAAADLVDKLRQITLRAVTVRPNANLEVNRSLLQGWSMAVNGSAIFADRASFVGIDGSFFVNNQGRFVTRIASGAFTDARGMIHLRGVSTALVSNSRFFNNGMAYGGAIYAIGVTQGGTLRRTNLTVLDSVFRENFAEDGGAIFAEASTLVARRNLFAGNGATWTYLEGRPLERVWEGGDVYVEDTNTTLTNNIFVQSDTFDHGVSLALVREDTGQSVSTPVVLNNAFVDFRGDESAGVILLDGSGVDFRNNVVSGDGVAIFGRSIPSNFVPASAIVYNSFAGMGVDRVFSGELSRTVVNQSQNIFEEPRFVYYPQGGALSQWASWRFWLRLDSPLIDAGDPSMTDVGGSRIDIGPYGGSASGAVDNDGDGWNSIYDCDDNDPTVYPGAYEECDGKDNDCNGIIDDLETLYYPDRDRDGFGDMFAEAVSICPGDSLPPPPTLGGIPGLWVEDNTDCDDTDPLRNPGQPEICDGKDNDCDGIPDNNIPARQFFRDNDGDGFGNPLEPIPGLLRCPQSDNVSPFGTDCNDNDPTIHPLITVESRSHAPLASRALEANEADRDLAFVADFIDQSCDGGDLCYYDGDGDGFGEEPLGGVIRYQVDNDLNCNNDSASTSSNALDCDDSDPAINPDATEIPADGVDQNCDGLELCYIDRDGDGWGVEETRAIADFSCTTPGFAPRCCDCDDDDPEVNPGAQEVCDGKDNNCNGVIDEVLSSEAERFFRDADADGFGVLANSILACAQPIGYAPERSEGFDCDDDNARIFPGATEFCDGLDNNCDGVVDGPDAVDRQTFYLDLDGDGYGNCDVPTRACSQPPDHVPANRPCDCDDSDPNIGPCACEGCSTGLQGGTSGALGLVALLLAGVRRRSAGSEGREPVA